MALRLQLPISSSGHERILVAIPEPARDEGAIADLSRVGARKRAIDCPEYTVTRNQSTRLL